MKRSLGAIAALLLLSGCRSPAPPNDPFLYRSTIPPPGTIAPGAVGTPYYSAPAAVPGPAAPAGVAPVAPITPAPAPVAPVPGATVPVAPPSKYSPPGGFNYQSSLRPPPTLPATIPAASAPVARPVDTAVVAAGSWQPANDARQENAFAAQPFSQPRPDPSVVRIVEPAKPAAATGIDAAQSPNARTDASQPASAQPATLPSTISANPVAATMTAPPGAAATQTAAPLAITELTDLPAVGTTPQDAAKPTAGAPQPPAAAADRPAPTNIPAEQPGTTYGYDPDYKTLRGKLEYSVATRRWKLIYLPPDGPIDEYGGTVVLPDPTPLNGFEAGQFVTVQGTFTPPAAGSGAPMFAIQRIKRQ